MYAARPGGPGTPEDDDMSDWTVDAADAVEKYVAMLRDRTVEPAHAITRIVGLRPARRARSRCPRCSSQQSACSGWS